MRTTSHSNKNGQLLLKRGIQDFIVPLIYPDRPWWIVWTATPWYPNPFTDKNVEKIDIRCTLETTCEPSALGADSEGWLTNLHNTDSISILYPLFFLPFSHLAQQFLPSATKLRWLCFYTCLSVCPQGVGGLPQCMLGYHTREQAPPPPPTANGYCCGRYASYWNAFFKKKTFCRTIISTIATKTELV